MGSKITMEDIINTKYFVLDMNGQMMFCNIFDAYEYVKNTVNPIVWAVDELYGTDEFYFPDDRAVSFGEFAMQAIRKASLLLADSYEIKGGKQQKKLNRNCREMIFKKYGDTRAHRPEVKFVMIDTEDLPF